MIVIDALQYSVVKDHLERFRVPDVRVLVV